MSRRKLKVPSAVFYHDHHVDVRYETKTKRFTMLLCRPGHPNKYLCRNRGIGALEDIARILSQESYQAVGSCRVFLRSLIAGNFGKGETK